MNNGVTTSLADLVRIQHKARGFSFLPRQPITSILSGPHASKLRGRGLNFEELRNYLPGDDIRAMDWKATHRTGSPHVRVFTEERDRPAYIILDQRQNMFFGSVERMKSVAAAELAAVSAWRVLDQGDRIGALVFNDSTISQVQPQRSQKAVLRILHEVERYNVACAAEEQPSPSEEKLNEVLEIACRLAKHDCLICVISDFIGANADTKRHMTHLAQHNDVIVGFVFDPLEAHLPSAGWLTFSSGDRQIEVDTARATTRHQFADLFEQRLGVAKQILLQRAVPLLPISTAEDPLQQLQRVLGFAP